MCDGHHNIISFKENKDPAISHRDTSSTRSSVLLCPGIWNDSSRSSTQASVLLHMIIIWKTIEECYSQKFNTNATGFADFCV